MNREDAYRLTLDAIAKMQWNMAMILEAKAFETEKVRNWILTHVTTDSVQLHSQQLSASLKFHEQNVELLDGLTKLCNGMNRSMKSILTPAGEDEGGMSALLGGFGSGDSDS
ncbi:restriction endonuclease subunit S [Cohnella sp. REN36]|uniref:restriction endonuclease subunit S n=1 Tax=Cohnella sp. REN36 TaxID=2887347 RepID=UPI001D153FBB|nr:restriction endonuclease subunit S [Cohnella sp. REN36]MCC3377306.1 restriction endonuclease subunit S [Cohnella sp. REN36]